MIRTYKPKYILNISKLLWVCSKLHNKNIYPEYEEIISQHFKENIPESIISYIEYHLKGM